MSHDVLEDREENQSDNELLRDLAVVMNSPEGSRFLIWLMNALDYPGPPVSDPGQIARQQLGYHLCQLMLEAQPAQAKNILWVLHGGIQ